MGRAEEIHGEGQVPVPHLPVLPQEDHPVCGHADVHLEPGGGARHGAGHHLHPHPGRPPTAQTQCPEQVPESSCGMKDLMAFASLYLTNFQTFLSFLDARRN